MAGMVECSTCGKDISSSAKVCPNCGAKRKSTFGKILKWGGLGLLALIVIGIFVPSEDSGTTSYAGDAPRNTPNTPEAYLVGDSVRAGDISVSVQSVSTSNSVGSQYFSEQAGQGATYVIVDWAFINEGNEPMGMFSTPSIHLIDPNGVEYDADIGASASYATEKDFNSKALSDVNPGIQVNDGEVFEVASSRFEQPGWKVKVENGRSDVMFDIP